MGKKKKEQMIYIQNDYEDKLIENPRLVQFDADNARDRYNILFYIGKHAFYGYKLF